MWAIKYKTCVPEYDIFCQTYVRVLYFDITCFEIRLSLRRILKNSLFLLTIFLFSTILKILNWLLMTQKKQSMSTIYSYHWNQTKFHHRFLKGNQRRNGQPQNFSLKFSVSVKELSGFLNVVYTKNPTLFLLKITKLGLKIEKKFGHFKKWKTQFQFPQTLEHFHDEIVFKWIWTTKMNNLNNGIFPTPTMNRKTQKLVTHHGT